MTIAAVSVSAVSPEEAEFDAAMEKNTDDTPKSAIWHYGKAEGLKGILESGKIWATHYGYTNDPKEIRIGEHAVLEVINELAKSASGPPRAIYQELAARYKHEGLTSMADVYIACFTEDIEHPGDELSQWREYGDAGSGYSLGLFPAPLVWRSGTPSENPTLGAYLVRVEYDLPAFKDNLRASLQRLLGVHNAQVSRGVASPSLAGTSMMRQVAALVPRLKDAFFKNEREWRYVVIPTIDAQKSYRTDVRFRSSQKGLVPYVELPLCSADEKLPIQGVVTGPGLRGGPRGAAAAMLLCSRGYDGGKLVKPSRGAIQ